MRVQLKSNIHAGGFEQVDLARHKKRIVDLAYELVGLVGHKLVPSSTTKTAMTSTRPLKKSKAHANGKSSNVTQEAVKVDERCVTALRDLQNIWGMFTCRAKFTGLQQDRYIILYLNFIIKLLCRYVVK